MKKTVLLSTLASLIIGGGIMLNAAEPKKGPTTKPSTTTAPAKPINKFCPLEPDHEIDPKVTTVYQNKTIGFCCADCIDEFKKDPEKYMKKLK